MGSGLASVLYSLRLWEMHLAQRQHHCGALGNKSAIGLSRWPNPFWELVFDLANDVVLDISLASEELARRLIPHLKASLSLHVPGVADHGRPRWDCSAFH